MRFLAFNECQEWCAERGVLLNAQGLPAPDSEALHEARLTYVDEPGHGTMVRPETFAATLEALGPWDECLLWITLWGIWPSTEDWPHYYLRRGDLGERRSLEEAPGHLALGNERVRFTEFLNIVMAHAWEGYALAARGRVVTARAFVSHDEWVALSSRTPFALSKPRARAV